MWGVLKAVWSVVSNRRVREALTWIRLAGDMVGWSEEQRREWVVRQLIGRFHVPESVARLLLELAYQIYKAQRGGGA
jgi:hypothetical protein